MLRNMCQLRAWEYLLRLCGCRRVALPALQRAQQRMDAAQRRALLRHRLCRLAPQAACKAPYIGFNP